MEENEIKNTLKKISEEIELLKDEARKKGLAFYAPSLEQLEKKLRSVNTPFIKMVMWTSNGHISDQ